MMRHLLHLPAVLLTIGSLIVPSLAHGQATETVLHHFAGAPTDGAFSSANLIQAADGNFYGTTRGGGSADAGTIFKMNASGTVTILHNFGVAPSDGYTPWSGVIQGMDGNFYGTTRYGGSGAVHVGTVFKMNQTGTVTIMHSFTDGADGGFPDTALVQATDGDLYGANTDGGTSGRGIFFKITTSGTFTILHNFSDGSVPNEGFDPNTLIQASDGAFYGTTSGGGSAPGGQGTVFKITSSGSVTILHNFLDGSVSDDGVSPQSGLVQGNDGNFYGTTSGGGPGSSSLYGTAFKMTPSGSVTILHRFSVTNDGYHPAASLIQAADGNFYGTTAQGGSNSWGTVFCCTPTGSETVVYNLGATSGDGGFPKSGVVQDSNGYLYGTTSGESIDNLGVIYKLAVPSIMQKFVSTDTPALPPWALTGLGLVFLLMSAHSLTRKKSA